MTLVHAARAAALAVMQRLLKDAGGGLLEDHLGPLMRRLTQLTQHQRLNLGEAQSRLRFPSIGARPAGQGFDTVVAATLQRRKLWIEYHARSTDERSERNISPQRITHYRETWYLDAWDEERNALRTFTLGPPLIQLVEPETYAGGRQEAVKELLMVGMYGRLKDVRQLHPHILRSLACGA